jgi:hypothetical protein
VHPQADKEKKKEREKRKKAQEALKRPQWDTEEQLVELVTNLFATVPEHHMTLAAISDKLQAMTRHSWCGLAPLVCLGC